ncbi:hypothetical protein ACFL1G_08295 [Planctomycetota bacterium]
MTKQIKQNLCAVSVECGGDSFSLDWDENANCKIGIVSGSSLVYNWDGKLRNATYDAKLIKLRYETMGNRIWKDSSEAGTRKYKE